MDIEDVVYAVMIRSDVLTLITLRTVCKTYYTITDRLPITDHPYSFKKSFWNTIFLRRLRESTSPLHRPPTVESEGEKIDDFIRALGEAILNCDVATIKTLYDNITEEQLKILRTKSYMLQKYARFCKDFRIAIAVHCNDPYVLPIPTINSPEQLNDALGELIVGMAVGLRDTFLRNAVQYELLDDAELIYRSGEVDHIEVCRGIRSVVGLKWVITKNLDMNNKIYSILIKNNLVDCLNYLQSVRTKESDNTCEYDYTFTSDESDEDFMSNNYVAGTKFNTERCITGCLLKYNIEALEWILRRKPVINWKTIYNKLCKSEKVTVASLHLCLKYCTHRHILSVAINTRSRKIVEYVIRYCIRHNEMTWPSTDKKTTIEVALSINALHREYVGTDLWTYRPSF